MPHFLICNIKPLPGSIFMRSVDDFNNCAMSHSCSVNDYVRSHLKPVQPIGSLRQIANPFQRGDD